jgi:tRNA(Leu) C34 or U34 (ribose-2'-O)-methylase TrmL
MRGYFGIGIYHSKAEVNIGTLWRSAFIYDASFVFTIGRRYKKQASDTVKTWRHIPLLHFGSFDDLKNHGPYNCPIVCVETADKAVTLPRFSHPERAIYLLGAEDHGIPAEVMRGRSVVAIPARLCLNVAVAGSIVMYDRYVKRILE